MARGYCHCLCVVNHRDVMGICLGASSDLEIAFESSLTGRVNVAMCSPCAAATLANTERPGRLTEDDE